MSRILFFNLDGTQSGEIHANCNRGWAINDGGKATLTLPASDAIEPWLQFGRMALMVHGRKSGDTATGILPMWGGMIDPPWRAMQPVQMNIYNAEYLLSLRAPDVRLQLHGRAAKVALQLVGNANKLETLPIVEGELDLSTPSLDEETFELNSIWDQLVAYIKKHGMEMQFRPGLDPSGRIVVYMDVQRRIGNDTNFLLQDGDLPNMQITDAQVIGTIYNRAIGNSNGSSAGKDLNTNPMTDDDSIQKYRLRNTVMQFANQTYMSSLKTLTRNALDAAAWPRLKITTNVIDQGDTFSHLRLGNSLIVHASKLILPGGVQGWKGIARIMAMAYDESKNLVTMNLEAAL